MLDEAGVVTGIFCEGHDVTDRRRAEAALRESQAQLASFLDNSPDSLFVKDAAGRYTLINRAFLARAGLAEEEVLGRTDGELFPPPLAERFAAADREVRETGEARATEETFGYQGRTYTFLRWKFPLPGGAVGGIGSDVTDRKRTELLGVRSRSVVAR